jgi:hypothetical protein
MNKSPYELRYELLNFARDSLTSEYYAKIEELKSLTDGSKIISTMMPKYPSKDDIFKLAEEYKNFIERK